MLKEALEYLAKLSNDRPGALSVGGVMHIYDDDRQKYSKYESPLISTLSTSSISSIYDFFESKVDGLVDSQFLVHVFNPFRIEIKSALRSDNGGRNTLLSSTTSVDCKNVISGQPEDFVVAVLHMFEDNEDRQHLLALTGNVEQSDTISRAEDGVSQRVIVRQGVNKMSVEPKDFYSLIPRRGFAETKNIESKFVLRASGEGPNFCLTELDNKDWALREIAQIVALLKEQRDATEGTWNIIY